jgi:hypothetical protein
MPAEQETGDVVARTGSATMAIIIIIISMPWLA